MTIPYLYELAIAGASVSHGHISSFPWFDNTLPHPPSYIGDKAFVVT